MEYLLDKTSAGQSKVELGNRDDRTLLHVAALTDNPQLVTYLLDKHHASKSAIWNHKVISSLSGVVGEGVTAQLPTVNFFGCWDNVGKSFYCRSILSKMQNFGAKKCNSEKIYRRKWNSEHV